MSDTSITQVVPQNVTYSPGDPAARANREAASGNSASPSKTDDLALTALAPQQQNTDRHSFKDYPTFDDAALSQATKNEGANVKAYANAVNERNKDIDALDKVLAYQDSFEATGATPNQAQQFQDYEKQAFNKALHAELMANSISVNSSIGDQRREHDVDKLLGMKDGKSPATGESTDAYLNYDFSRDVEDHFVANHVFGAGMPKQNADGSYT